MFINTNAFIYYKIVAVGFLKAGVVSTGGIVDRFTN
jgi:hypothetical protein